MTTPAAAGVRRPVVLARPLGPRRPGRPAARPGRRRPEGLVTVPGLRRVISAAARGQPRTMMRIPGPGHRRAVVPAGRPRRRMTASAARSGLHPEDRVGLRATADAIGTADAIAGHLRVTTGLLRRVTEPAGRSAKMDPQGSTGRPGRATQATASTGADRDPRTEIPTAHAKGPVLAAQVPVTGIALAGLRAVTRVGLAAGARGRLLVVLRIGLRAAKMARLGDLPAAAPGRDRRGTAVATGLMTVVMTAAVSARHGRPAGAKATGRRNAPAAGDRGLGGTRGAGVRSRRTSRARAFPTRSAPSSSIPKPAPS
jgi:hypothetical protein